jgi:hypothetical protein
MTLLLAVSSLMTGLLAMLLAGVIGRIYLTVICVIGSRSENRSSERGRVHQSPTVIRPPPASAEKSRLLPALEK